MWTFIEANVKTAKCMRWPKNLHPALAEPSLTKGVSYFMKVPSQDTGCNPSGAVPCFQHNVTVAHSRIIFFSILDLYTWSLCLFRITLILSWFGTGKYVYCKIIPFLNIFYFRPAKVTLYLIFYTILSKVKLRGHISRIEYS